MFTPTAIGLFVGRFLFSYLLVLIVFLLFNKFKFKTALGKLHSIKGIAIVLVVFVLPIIATLGQRI